jgi:ATP phosphoribosyltransferase regulatory subunit
MRGRYRDYGYTQYVMSRFEEYELYANNRSFLASDDIITFTGSGGKLMALRPDVTLSIVKNTLDEDGLRKLYYSENVYRPTHVGREFKERMQVGLECVGDIGVYEMGETVYLACMSLSEISGGHCLDISHMGFLGGLLDNAELTPDTRAKVLALIGAKNAPELAALCDKSGVRPDARERLLTVASLYGAFEETIDKLAEISVDAATDDAVTELRSIYDCARALGAATDIRLDFSVVNDMRYYNGVIFQGYVEGIPTAVLSGGRYDSLLKRFGRRSGAIGFAVYVDLLERLDTLPRVNDADVLLLYGDDASPTEVARAVRSIIDSYETVRAQKDTGGAISFKYEKLARLVAGKVVYDD